MEWWRSDAAVADDDEQNVDKEMTTMIFVPCVQ